MLSFTDEKVRYYPGESWVYYKIYIGPMTADDWLRGSFQDFISEVDDKLEAYSYFFVRYLDPDFHLRLRIRITDANDFVKVIAQINKVLYSLQFGDLWKVEICTYTRELERYGKHIGVFEQAFCADSVFWSNVFKQTEAYDEFENVRWKLALTSMYQYYTGLMGSGHNWISILEACVYSLQNEIEPTKSFIYQTDQKYRHHQDDLEKYITGERIVEMGLEVLFRDRSDRMKELFGELIIKENFFKTPKGRQNITDLVHMSLNRGLRSKHRVQEFVLYRYLLKLVRKMEVLNS